MKVLARILLELWDPNRKALPSEMEMLEQLCREYPAFSLPFALLAIHTQEGQPSIHEAAVKSAAVRMPERERLFDRLHRDFARPFEQVGEPFKESASTTTGEPKPHVDPMEEARRKVRQILEENRRMRERAALESVDRLAEEEPPTLPEQPDIEVVDPGLRLHAPLEPALETDTLTSEFPASIGVQTLGEQIVPNAQSESSTNIESVEEPKGGELEQEIEAKPDVRMSLEEWLRNLETDESARPLEFKSSELSKAAETQISGLSDRQKSKSLKIKKKKRKKLEKKALKQKWSERSDPETKSEDSKQGRSKKDKFELIDRFIEKLPELRPEKNLKTESDSSKPGDSRTDDGAERTSVWMTETLAELYVEQKHFRLALEAYEILLLKFPEKSGFFAARISELRKRAESQA